MKPISIYVIRYHIQLYLYFDLQENIFKKVKKAYYMSAGFVGRHVVGFADLNIDIFLEIQDKRCSSILYLIGYIAYGLHL